MFPGETSAPMHVGYETIAARDQQAWKHHMRDVHGLKAAQLPTEFQLSGASCDLKSIHNQGLEYLSQRYTWTSKVPEGRNGSGKKKYLKSGPICAELRDRSHCF